MINPRKRIKTDLQDKLLGTVIDLGLILRFQDLPSDILKNVIALLPQVGLIRLNLTCRELYNLVNQHLYSNIYITDHPPRTAGCHEWSILYNGPAGTGGNKVKQFELSLRANFKLITLIKHIISDDLKFLLFKLKSWSRIFFQPNLGLCQLNSLYFGNVPLNHFNSGYDDLMQFYQMFDGQHKFGNRLTQLQLRGVQDLVQLLDNGYIDENHCQIEDISFIIMDLSEINLKNLKYTNYHSIKTKLLKIFGQLRKFSVISVHDLSLKFISNLNQFLQGDLLFNSVEQLRVNHCHGQTTNEDVFVIDSTYELQQETRLDFGVISLNFNLAKLKVLDLKFGCNHLHCPTNDEFNDCNDDLIELQSCNCERQFIQDFTHSGIRVRNLTMERIDKSALANVFNLVHFKQLVHYYLKQQHGQQFSKLTINSNAELYPFFQFEPSEVNFIRDRINSINAKLVRSFGRIAIRTLVLPDYIESFCNWQVDLQQLLPYSEEVRTFISVNEQIQFYLNPMINKTAGNYLYDLVAAVLRLLQHGNKPDVDSPRGNSSIGDNEIVGQTAKATSSSHLQNHIPPVNNDYQGPMGRGAIVPDSQGPLGATIGPASLHDLFRHDTYKELVNYNLVRNIMNRRWVVQGSGSSTRLTTTTDLEGKSRQIDITCQCHGHEVDRFVRLISQQVSKHIGDFASEIVANNFRFTSRTTVAHHSQVSSSPSLLPRPSLS